MTLRPLAVLAVATGLASASAAEQDARLYEMRTYHAAPDKLEALLTRFREHTVTLFKKHGMTNVGYWVPVDNKDQLLIYLLAYPDRAARDTAWKAFNADPEWQQAKAASETGGTLVAKVDELFLSSTDFSQGFPVTAADSPARLFEMRTYTATPSHLPNLHARFRDHTLGFFKQHQMTSLGYFQPVEGQPGHEDTLVYFLAHKDQAAADASWAAFKADPGWVEAKKASETAAGGSLTTVPDGVKSVFLKPVDFSPVR